MFPLSSAVLLSLLLLNGCCKDDPGDSESVVSDFVGRVMSTTSLERCSLVICHDYARLPDQFSKLMKDASSGYRSALEFRVTEDSFQQPRHNKLSDLWDFFERRNKAGGCVLHFLTTRHIRDVTRFSLFHAFNTKVEGGRDHFVVWTTVGRRRSISMVGPWRYLST